MNQLLHAFGPIDGKTDELFGICIEPVFIALGQQLGEAHDHSQRLLQVMRSDVRESLEIGVGSRELLGLFGIFTVGRFELPRSPGHHPLQFLIEPAMLLFTFEQGGPGFIE